MNTYKRRDFMKTVAAGSAALTFLNNINFEAFASPLNSATNFTGGITAFSIMNDIALLATAGKQISLPNAERINADINYPIAANLSRVGAMVTFKEEEVQSKLKKLKKELQSLDNQLTKDLQSQKNIKSDLMKQRLILEKKVSLLLGWYMAAGIRSELIPLYEMHEKSKGNLLSEMSIYHDMFVLNQVAGTGEQGSANDVTQFFQGLQPRMICRTHTMTPDYDDGKNWTVRITNWRDDSMVLMEKYAAAYVKPDKNKLDQFITKINFYNPDDEIIKLARWVQVGNYIKSIDKVVEKDSGQSIYANSVVKGIKALKKADRILIEG